VAVTEGVQVWVKVIQVPVQVTVGVRVSVPVKVGVEVHQVPV